MPIPFDQHDAPESHDTVGWLRFVTKAGDPCVYGSLLQTGPQGRPLAFCFARIDRSDSSLREDALVVLAKALFLFPDRSPSLLLALQDEFPAETLAPRLRLRLPCCLIAPNDADSASPLANWLTRPPSDADDAYRLLGDAMTGDPLDVFARSADAMEEAFADERVQALTATHGLVTVVDLTALPDRLGPADTASSGAVESELPKRPLTLPERMWAALGARRRDSPADPEPQLEWPAEFMPFQKDGIAALLGNDRLLLADDMGLGKTVQAIAAIRILRARNEAGPCLVVAPASLLNQWRKELGRWAPDLSAIIVDGPAAERSWKWPAKKDVKLVSYETLRSDFGSNALAPVRREQWSIVVADEAQRIKNRNDTSDALKGLQRARSWALTGTPIENNEEELASILEFVDYDGADAPARYHPGPELRARHSELQLRRKKQEVLDDLPPKQVTLLPITLNPHQHRSYEKAERDGIVYLKSLGAEVTVQHVFALLTRLKQICNVDPQTGESSKLDDIRDRIEQLIAQGHKALVFSQYVDDAHGVGAAVRRLQDFSPLVFTGGMSSEERQSTIDRFKTSPEHQVLVMSLRAGGLGLNLQEASYVFHLDRWWNPAIERQAEDRSHRMGQTVKVNVIKYSCVGTIEERIDRILERKQGLFDQLIDDVSLDLSTQLNREELFGLFGL